MVVMVMMMMMMTLADLKTMFFLIMLLLLSSINAVCCHQYRKIRAILYENRNMKEKPDESHWQGFKGRKCLQKDFKAVNEDVIITVVISI